MYEKELQGEDIGIKCMKGRYGEMGKKKGKQTTSEDILSNTEKYETLPVTAEGMHNMEMGRKKLWMCYVHDATTTLV
jgi:hypothetical protein